MLNSILWVILLKCGMADMPKRFSPTLTVYYAIRICRDDGTGKSFT